jgi:hypothetical protein
MIEINKINESNATAFGRVLFNDETVYSSFETLSQVVVKKIYDEFQQADGSPAFALVRIYRLTQLKELPEEIKPLVDVQRERWMCLMGTYGKEEAWQSRHTSQGHKALNIGADQSPMLSAALYQLGLDVGVEYPKPALDMSMDNATFMTRYFHVEKAPGSPFIPAQDPFVKPYSIQSVVGIGNGFVSKSSYVLLAFSQANISDQQARDFSQLAPFVGALLARYDAKKIWG